MKAGTLVPVVDRAEAWRALARRGYRNLIRQDGRCRVQATGEYRCPKTGEWFISGAIPEGYYAHVDLPVSRYIGRLVLTETVTTVVVREQL